MQQLNMEEKTYIQGSVFGKVVSLFNDRGFLSSLTYRYTFLILFDLFIYNIYLTCLFIYINIYIFELIWLH